ncbi:MAG TPA: radical SAM protein, partial [Allosphingosinicella sp.]
THLNVTIAATLKCNLACGYCFQGQNKPSKRMDDEVQEKLVAFVASRLAGMKSLTVCWYGGEPLMNPEEIWRTAAALQALCAEKEVSYSSFIITNGYLLTAEIARRLVDHGVGGAQITIDGVGEHHDRMRPHISGRGSFDRILANVEEALANSDLRISLRISVDTENAAGVRALLHLLAEKGLAKSGRLSVYFAPIEAISSGCTDYEPLSLSKQLYAQLEVELIRLATSLKLQIYSFFGQDLALCQAVRPNDLIITPNGDLHKCWDTVSFGQMKVGNIAQADVTGALRDNVWTDWVPTRNPVCPACKILPICGGGCAYKTVHPGQMAGEAASLPCISLKFNLAERLFEVCLASGVVEPGEWHPELSPTFAEGELKTGERHTYESMRAASARYLPASARPAPEAGLPVG